MGQMYPWLPMCRCEMCIEPLKFFSDGCLMLSALLHSFISVSPSGKYPLINDDLVNSHHLLLCCLDMIYSAAYTKRRDLLHPDCPIKVSEDDAMEDGQSGTTDISVLGQLCDMFNGVYVCVCVVSTDPFDVCMVW